MKTKDRVYIAKEKLQLLKPNGKTDGFLDEGDAIFVLKRLKINGVSNYQFRVIKFFETEKETTTYTSEVKYFKKMQNSDKKVSVSGEEENSNEVINKKNVNKNLPIYTGVGLGVAGYFIGEKFQQPLKGILIGLGIGIIAGIFIVKSRNEKKSE